MKTKTLALSVIILLAFGMLTGLLTLTTNSVKPAYALQTPLAKTSSSTAVGQPIYLTATLLTEELANGIIVDLSPVQSIWFFHRFYILLENGAFKMWLNNSYDAPGQRVAIEQYLESDDGLVWRNRTNTNLIDNTPDYHILSGIRQVISDTGFYQGWETTYYNVVSGAWVRTIRYVTSTDGITWQIVTPSILASADAFSLVHEGNQYEMWVPPYGAQAWRYRTSSAPDSGWGPWQTGGTPILVDGAEVKKETRVRKLTDGTYQLFYRPANTSTQINLAIGTNGFIFTTVVTNMINYATVLPEFDAFYDFMVVDVNGEDWFYFTYRDTNGLAHVAVSKPTFPMAELTAVNDSPTILGSATNLTATISGGTQVTFAWDLGDGTTGTGAAVTHTYADVGVYTAVVTATNSVSTLTATTIVTIIEVLPIPQTLLFLPVVMTPEPVVFPLFIGSEIEERSVTAQGEIFYQTTIQIPAVLPATGKFYLSSTPDQLHEIIIDDELVITHDNIIDFAYKFSSDSQPPVPVILELPRSILSDLAGQSVTVLYQDIYAVYVSASEVWLVWVP